MSKRLVFSEIFDFLIILKCFKFFFNIIMFFECIFFEYIFLNYRVYGVLFCDVFNVFFF